MVATSYTSLRVLSEQGPVRVELARWQGKLVVVKRLFGISPLFAERLQREAEVVAKLDHDNILPLLAHDGATLIYAYADGVPFSDKVDAWGLCEARTLSVIGDVLQALEYAHQHGVIHCDVKPANIILHADRALLSDFGFAKDLALASITSQGMRLGTPNYMAPEQFHGDRSDPRSDLYAVGAMLYHIATGSPPYGDRVLYVLAGDTTIGLEPLPPDAAPLADIIATALSPDPAARFASAHEMLAALRRATDTTETGTARVDTNKRDTTETNTDPGDA